MMRSGPERNRNSAAGQGHERAGRASSSRRSADCNVQLSDTQRNARDDHLLRCNCKACKASQTNPGSQGARLIIGKDHGEGQICL